MRKIDMLPKEAQVSKFKRTFSQVLMVHQFNKGNYQHKPIGHKKLSLIPAKLRFLNLRNMHTYQF
jgi:hypothetical protein